MRWVLVTVGALLVLLALWDVFHTLWHPLGQGRVSKTVMVMIWRLSRSLGSRGRRMSGPVALGAVIVCWAGLVVLGWALIYWPWLPGGFAHGPGPAAGQGSDAVDALYLSMVTLSTLGFGDIVPTSVWMRLATPLEALIGFGLLTAAVSWVLQVYPALARRRVLALKLATMHGARSIATLGQLHPAAAADLLADLADRLIQVRVDLTQYAETYYFSDADAETSLAVQIAYAHELAITGQHAAAPEVRHNAEVLGSVLAGFAGLLDRQFLHLGAGTADVLRSYRDTQGVPGS